MFKKIAILTIVLGAIAIALNMLFGENTIIFVEKTTHNGMTLYKYNFWAYIENIRLTITDPSELELHGQPLTWRTITTNILQEQFWEDLGNNMAFILNYIIFAINILIYPLRIAAFTSKSILAIIGINLNQPGALQWLVNTIRFLTELQIPYVYNS